MTIFIASPGCLHPTPVCGPGQPRPLRLQPRPAECQREPLDELPGEEAAVAAVTRVAISTA